MQAKKSIEIKYNNVDDTTKEFYFYLGLLSTKFAVVEYNLLLLLGRLIADDFVLTNTVLERNSLSQNIDLLKKMNKYIQFEEKKMAILIDKISRIRSTRNLFIHGIWENPTHQENDLVINCTEPKLAYEENNKGRKWSSARHHSFRLSYIKRLVEQTDIIILEQEYLFRKLDDTE